MLIYPDAPWTFFRLSPISSLSRGQTLHLSWSSDRRRLDHLLSYHFRSQIRWGCLPRLSILVLVIPVGFNPLIHWSLTFAVYHHWVGNHLRLSLPNPNQEAVVKVLDTILCLSVNLVQSTLYLSQFATPIDLGLQD